MPLADMYELRVRYTFQNVDMLNVFHVERLDSAYSADDVVDAYLTSIEPPWINAAPQALTFSDVECESLGNPLDFYSASLVSSGGEVGTPVARFAAWGFRFLRTTKAIRHGFKRFGGVNEEMISNGVATAGITALLNTLGSAIVAIWQHDFGAGLVDVCRYVVIKRIKYTTAKGTTAYRLPESDAELSFYAPTQFLLETRMTTQNSRKT